MNEQRHSRRKFPSLEKEGWLRPPSPRRGIFAVQTSRLIVLLFFLCISAEAQETKQKPDISGFWELRFDSKNVPQASFNARVTPKDIEAHRQKDLMAIRWCNFLG